MQKFIDNVTDVYGNAIATATVGVYTDSAHTNLATIYSDNGVTVTTNPLTTDSTGTFSFYAANNRYYIKVSKTGITTQYFDDVILFDPNDSSATNTGAAYTSFIQSGTGATSRTLQTKVREIEVSVGDFGCVGDGSTDDTTNFQKAIDSGANRVVVPQGFNCYLNGAIVTLNHSNFELVIDGKVTKGNSGATFQIGSTSGTYSNIKVTGAGKITASAVPHTVASAGIILGAASVTLDNIFIDVDIINMGQYAVASGNAGATITNLAFGDRLFSVNPTGWMGGADVAQAVDINLTGGAGTSTGRLNGGRFSITDGSGTTDCFKWRGFSGTITGARFDNGSASVLTLTDALNFAVTGIKLTKTANAGAGLVVGLTSSKGKITGVEAQTTTTTIPMFYWGASATITGVEVSDFRTNGVMGAGASTTCSACILKDATTGGGGVDWSGLTAFSSGVIDGATTAGRIIVTGNSNIIRACNVNMGGTAVEGINATGNNNQILDNYVLNTTASGVKLAGNTNLVNRLTADNCSNAINIASGTSNVVGFVDYMNGSGAITDSGTTSVLPMMSFTALTGSVTVSIPPNPTGHTVVKFSALTANTTVTNFTGPPVGYQLTVLNDDSGHSLTVDRSNAVLSGGVNAVLNQFYTLKLIKGPTYWESLGAVVANS